jgi:hypothetical protein
MEDSSSTTTNTTPAEESEQQECPICEGPGGLLCSGCNAVSYCSPEHQRLHWKSHKKSCRPFLIKRSEQYGRYLVAARDLEEGTIVMTESPVAVGPKRASYPVCLGCHKRVDGSYLCSKCTFPMCNEKCENVSTSELISFMWKLHCWGY